MKNKILTIVICAIVLVAPTVVAIFSYTNAQKNPVSRASVSQMDVVDPEGKMFTFQKTDKSASDMFDCFFDMKETATAADSLPSAESDYDAFEVTYKSYNRTVSYTFYFTEDEKNVYFRDHVGQLFRVNAEPAARFLESKYALCLFSSSPQPVLSVGSVESVLPATQVWKYPGYNGVYLDSEVQTSAETVTCTVTGGLPLTFNIAPDSLHVTMTDKNGVVVHEGAPTGISPDLFTDNGTFAVTVTAKWNQTAGVTNYGEATYRFNANVLAPASFYLNTNEADYGDFVILSVKNVVNPSEILFTSEPSIGFEPMFFAYGGYHHALVPFSMVCEEANDKAENYTFTLSYGDVTDSFSIKVNPRKISSAYEKFTSDFINVHRSETALSEFAEIMRTPLGALQEDVYWLRDNMLAVPVTGRKISRGYGLRIILESTGQRYWHEGVNFGVKANDPVYACLPGKVVYVGDTRLSGTTVVVDHGGGLKSLYAHLGTTSISVGDVVEKGDMIAIVGSSGFCSGTSFHFGLYVFDVPVRYYDYETYGINLESTVAGILGLKQPGAVA